MLNFRKNALLAFRSPRSILSYNEYEIPSFTDISKEVKPNDSLNLFKCSIIFTSLSLHLSCD
nr:MAG TPA: hypothetical protein [Caudoviricetes sp.]